VNQETATDYIRFGATALGVGAELLPKEAIRRHQDHRIHELARRFIGFVREARGIE
jgi:2-keto-3-deoxy-6-phosphogluconate aldolase